MTAYKYDKGKQQFLIPELFLCDLYRKNPKSGWTEYCKSGNRPTSEIINAIEEVLQYGLKKYRKKDSWQEVDNAQERYKNALLRHTYSLGDDSESGLPHQYHALCNAMFLAWFELKGVNR